MPEPTCPLSIIICTRNRADSLQRCLNALPLDRIVAHDAELLLIDNASTDDTRAVLDRYASLAPAHVRALTECRPGLSNARNLGLSEARGAILAFTDDDCYTRPDFVDAIIEAMVQHTDVDFCGGRILLHDPSDALYTVSLQDTYEALPPGQPLRVGKIKGACMIMRRRVIETVGRFDPSMGAGSTFRCEDADYLARAALLGFGGAHIPTIVLEHHHGRKPGADIDAVKRDNDYGRGAHYAKCILMGGRAYFGHWIRETIRVRKPGKCWRELRGAWSYWRYWRRLDKAVRPGMRDPLTDAERGAP